MQNQTTPIVTVNEQKGTLTIEMPIIAGRKSKSGKNWLIASTNGNMGVAGAQYRGHDIQLNVNVTVPVVAEAAVAGNQPPAPKSDTKPKA